MKSEAFADALFSKKSSEEIQKLFTENGLELTAEELAAVTATILQGTSGNEELSEDALDSVAGGGLGWLAITLGYWYGRYKAKKK